MTALLQWITSNPVRAFLAAGLAAMLPFGAWLPAGIAVLCLLTGGSTLALPGIAGAGLGFLFAYEPIFGAGPSLAIAAVALLPAVLAAVALERSRSLSFTFQALTVACCFLVLAIHGLLGDPVRALAPAMAELEPVLRQMADTLSHVGIERTPEEIGAATASMAWATFGWMVLFNAFAAQCAGLWGYGRLREPGLFGREFRRLRLGSVVAWVLVAAFVAGLAAQRMGRQGWQARWSHSPFLNCFRPACRFQRA